MDIEAVLESDKGLAAFARFVLLYDNIIWAILSNISASQDPDLATRGPIIAPIALILVVMDSRPTGQKLYSG